jgi:hypothetical protein
MRTGEVEANLVALNEEFQLPYISDLVGQKLAGPEASKLYCTRVSVLLVFWGTVGNSK